jgi:hypothetical protein
MDDAATPKHRWYRVTPDRLILGLLAVEAFLLLSQWGGWFLFNQHKGWTVLMAVAAIGVTLLLSFIWFVASLVFRWRFQYSLRSLSLLIVTAAIPCSWLAREMQRARTQREAIATIVAAGGAVEYDSSPHSHSSTRTPNHPEWLERLLGVDFLADVTSLRFRDGKDVVSLDANLRMLRQLHWLDLTRSKVSDTDLNQLEGLDQLVVLSLSGTDAGDIGLRKLRCLPHLAILDLAETKVTDNGLVYLQTLPELQWLILRGTRITDAGLVHLQKLPRLESLILADMDITDAGLVHLKSMGQLKYLSLFNDINVTADGVKELQRALPQCTIDRSFGTDTLRTGFD